MDEMREGENKMIKPAVNFLPNAITCYNFIEVEGDVTTRKTVVLVPIKVTFEQDGVVVAWGCSLATFCKDPACLYSTLKHREKNWEEDPHYG